MTPLELWRQKLVQLLHDPPGKAFFIRPGAGGHKGIAKEIFEATAGVPLRFARTGPDRAAAGADRPVISPPTRTQGRHPISVDWEKRPVLTHPLSASHPLASGERSSVAIEFDDAERPRGSDATRTLADDVKRALSSIEPLDVSEYEIESMPEDERKRREREEEAKLASLPLWNDVARLQEVCWQIWRKWPDVPPEGIAEMLWRHQPADSRTPDHSLWDHLRVTSALAFMKDHKLEGQALPWLVAFSIGPVQRFIAESRTSRDLWTSSMLLSDLVWHAMEPFVERYGPESIVYPDLRGNPRADQWLLEQQDKGRWKDVVPENADGCSYAGIFPNTFIALLPRGAADGGVLEPLESVANEAREAVRSRWGKLAELAREYFVREAEKADPRGFEDARRAFDETWDRQHDNVLFTAWTAAAWPGLEKVGDPDALAIRDALPAQTPAPALSNEDRRALSAWRARHEPWLPSNAFGAYAEARHVYARTNLSIHQLQRGFDYPLIHHALHVRHAVRKVEAQRALLEGETGEKCTLCGLRQALGNTPDEDSIDRQREAVRDFWRRFDRRSEGGKERLCAVCTMKRVLIQAGMRKKDGRDEMAGLTAAWAGDVPIKELRDEDDRLRVPFPSTATIAAQEYLCAVAAHPDLRAEVEGVVRCCEAAGLPRTTFVRALRSLAEQPERSDAIGLCFLEYEAELTAFPEVMLAWEERAPSSRESARNPRGVLCDKRGDPIERPRVRDLRKAVEGLRSAARNNKVRPPDTQVAVLALDGDGIRKLLLGTRVGATWQDVIHPCAVQNVREQDDTRQAGWPDLLDKTRLLGPSTHAFINRVLATFVHTIVPWVVEREFEGRLIYAGGDDVLAIAPAKQALDIAARLAQLYSAAWVLDTQPDEEPWGWRKKGARIAQSADAASRFVVVVPSTSGEPIPWPIPDDCRCASVARPGDSRAASQDERLLPMMGSGQTLSAGIAIGHYKTPLGDLVQAAWDERDRAKGKFEDNGGRKGSANGNAFSLRRYTRGGEKARLGLPWGETNAPPDEAFKGYKRLSRLIDGFKDRRLPGRLPYKLRDVEEAVLAAWLQGAAKLPEQGKTDGDAMAKAYRTLIADVKAFAKGTFGTLTEGSADDAFFIWWQGLVEVLDIFDAPTRGTNDAPLESSMKKASDAIQRVEASRQSTNGSFSARDLGSEQGLAVCRFLGALARGEEDVR